MDMILNRKYNNMKFETRKLSKQITGLIPKLFGPYSKYSITITSHAAERMVEREIPIAGVYNSILHILYNFRFDMKRNPNKIHLFNFKYINLAIRIREVDGVYEIIVKTLMDEGDAVRISDKNIIQYKNLGFPDSKFIDAYQEGYVKKFNYDKVMNEARKRIHSFIDKL